MLLLDGYNTLISAVRDDHPQKLRAIRGLFMLCHQFAMNLNPACFPYPFNILTGEVFGFPSDFADPPYFPLDKDPNCEMVTIVFDDGQELIWQRNHLTKISEVFKAMLTTNFAEAQQNSIKIPSCSKDAFTYLVKKKQLSFFNNQFFLVRNFDWGFCDNGTGSHPRNGGASRAVSHNKHHSTIRTKSHQRGF